MEVFSYRIINGGWNRRFIGFRPRVAKVGDNYDTEGELIQRPKTRGNLHYMNTNNHQLQV